jgi:invasin B
MTIAISPQPVSVPTLDLSAAARGFGAQPVQAAQIEQLTQTMLAQMVQSTHSPGDARPLSSAPPQLRQPQTITPPGMSPEAALTQLVGELTATLRQGNVAELTARLEQYKARNDSVRVLGEQLGAEFSQAQTASTDALTAASTAAHAAEPLVAQAAQARAEADALELQLNTLSPQDPGYPAAHQAYQHARASADQLGQQAQAALAPLEGLNTAAAQAMAQLQAVEAKIAALPIVQPALVSMVRQASLTNAAVFSQLISTLSEVVSQANQAKLDSNSDLAIKQLRAAEKENLRKSEEYQKQMDKAEAAQKTMGCVGKILGWIVTVVSVIAAPFSGGASLALAAIGLALAITSEVTGFSLVGKALEPFTKHVLEPLINALGKAFTSMLESAGMNAEDAKRVGGILGAVVGAIIIVVVAAVAIVLGKAAGSAVIKSLTPALTRAFKDVIPAVVKQVARQAGQLGARLNGAVAKTLGTSVEKVTARVAVAHTVNTGLQVTGEVVKGSGNVVRASAEVDASQTLAALNNNLASNKAVQALMKSLEKEFADAGDFMVRLYELVAQSMKGQASTGRAILSAAVAA